MSLNSHGYNFFDTTTNLYTYGGGLDSGDTAWMLTSTALVLLMTMPGLAIYYSGMVRDKNVLACKFYLYLLRETAVILKCKSSNVSSFHYHSFRELNLE